MHKLNIEVYDKDSFWQPDSGTHCAVKSLNNKLSLQNYGEYQYLLEKPSTASHTPTNNATVGIKKHIPTRRLPTEKCSIQSHCKNQQLSQAVLVQ